MTERVIALVYLFVGTIVVGISATYHLSFYLIGTVLGGVSCWHFGYAAGLKRARLNYERIWADRPQWVTQNDDRIRRD